MSYYTGDYYRGDPGFFSVLGGLAKKAVGFIPGVGPALSAGLEAITARKASTAIVKAGGTSMLKRVGAGAKQVIAKHPVLSAAGAAGAIGVAAGAGATRLLRGGRGGGMRHHKRMNPCNVKALRRAIRRAHGFERIAKKVMRFSSPHKHKKFAGFKRAKKRS
jgi:hypothetical protein